MISENLHTLITKLKQKTKDKKVIWKKTSSNSEFKLSFQSGGAVTTDLWSDNSGLYVDFIVINNNGTVIERVVFTEEDEPSFHFISELHELAKKSYYKEDETYKNFFLELDNDDVIGDDLPF